jgi:hypothetical protein
LRKKDEVIGPPKDSSCTKLLFMMQRILLLQRFLSVDENIIITTKTLALG